MDYEEKTMKSEKFIKGRLLIYELIQLNCQIKSTQREIVEHPGSVGIIPITNDGRIILVKQYRKPVEKNLL